MDPRRTGNRFLDNLPADVTEHVARIAHLRSFDGRAVLGDRGDAIRQICFPVAGAIAHVETPDDGVPIEVFSVGCGGVSGFEALLDSEAVALFARVTHVPVSALLVDTHKMRTIVAGSAAARSLATRYALASVRLAGLAASCPRHAHMEARLAAWLLRLIDYTHANAFGLTHDYAASVLGVRRATVTTSFAALAERGAVRIARKRVEILDPVVLEAVTCGCRFEAVRILDGVYRDDRDGLAAGVAYTA